MELYHWIIFGLLLGINVVTLLILAYREHMNTKSQGLLLDRLMANSLPEYKFANRERKLGGIKTLSDAEMKRREDKKRAEKFEESKQHMLDKTQDDIEEALGNVSGVNGVGAGIRT